MNLVRRLAFAAGLVAFLLGSMAGPLWAQQKKKVYVAPDDHTDYIWSGTEAQYRQWFIDMLDYYLNQADVTASEPAMFQSRFSADGSFWLWTYERNKTAAEFQRLMNRIQDGHITAPLVPLVVSHGGMPAEAVIRSMYYPGRLERRFNVRFTTAHAMENQTMPFGLGALWAGAGAKYAWHGI